MIYYVIYVYIYISCPIMSSLLLLVIILAVCGHHELAWVWKQQQRVYRMV